MIRLLLIGPLPPPMGGDTRHFATLVEDLREDVKFRVRLINTSRGAHHSSFLHNLFAAVKTILTIISLLPRVDVISFHASDRGMLMFGPLVTALSRLARVPTIFRVFGGSFGDFYGAANGLTRTVLRKLVLSSDVVLLQTQRAIRQLQAHSSGKLVWFSTYIRKAARPVSLPAKEPIEAGARCRRFVFLGHLWRTKGLETILESADSLPGDCSLDIYGPLDEYTAEQVNERGRGRIRYCGFLSHAEVDAKLWEYDCLVLPTFHFGEGYPGVIAEAFAHALPVISTFWLAIPEMVDETCGILIEPQDTQAFAAAIRALYEDPARWARLREGARIRAAQFDHAVWSAEFERICMNLVRN